MPADSQSSQRSGYVEQNTNIQNLLCTVHPDIIRYFAQISVGIPFSIITSQEETIGQDRL
jgi:hypothetical protein